MLKRTVTYTDYNDVERTEDFYFNLTKTEITEMELSKEGGLSTKLEKIVQAQDGAEIVAVIKDVILRAYGEKSDDGRRFDKSHEKAEAFSHTPVYDMMFQELSTNAEAAAAFVNGITPKPA